ncbi:uncharacterized protein EI97DRAFT_9390 [Westerdykella ornata]|uniref:Uncharacterized protein n=1 Tax=Westerdykella ornata TaxID=318751 RepID=A0A6A6JW52_WESOR|nr:uncharacterized protein EI97DRAFT_9390 [Westerdykella ornata]KAF2280832.1 hypothetical protein EI97DRAFT_9390 [Westerdykella ornata]
MATRPSNEIHRVASYGRGGAGNISTDNPSSRPSANDLITPTLKSDLYTTGRGGTGNMARNDPAHPEIARASQDVEAPPHREPEGPHHFGRGGAANVATTSPEPQPVPQVGGKKEEEGRGKELLNRLKK